MKTKIRPLLETPRELVTGGRFNLGTFKGPFEVVNPLDVDLGGRLPRPRALKNLRLKEWQHFALVNDDTYISLALFNAKTLGLAQVCIYRRADKKVLFYERKPASWNIRIPGSLFDDHAGYEGKGFRLTIHNDLNRGHHLIAFDVAATKKLPAVSGRFTCHEDPSRAEPIVVCLPLKGPRAMYSHKYIGPVDGSLEVDGSTVSFSPKGAYCLVDIHKGYYPWVMKWHWATGGQNRDGAVTGFNLTDNQVEDQNAYNENCLWKDGKLFLLPPVQFTFDPRDHMRPWSIRDEDGMVELTFTPEVIRTVDVNALVIRSRYRGPFGSFAGTLRTGEGTEVPIENAFGMCEDFYLRT